MNQIACMIWLCLESFGISSAQNVSVDNEVPKISIEKLKWNKHIKFPFPMGVINTTPESRPNNPPDRPVEERNPFPPSGSLSIYYIYQAIFKNNGEKEIKGLVWDYVFIDIDSKQELKRHQFYSYEQVINRNRAVRFQRESSAAPSQIVSAKAIEKNKRSPFIEKIEIKCVIYADNSRWKDLETKEIVCERLRNLIKTWETWRR